MLHHKPVLLKIHSVCIPFMTNVVSYSVLLGCVIYGGAFSKRGMTRLKMSMEAAAAYFDITRTEPVTLTEQSHH